MTYIVTDKECNHHSIDAQSRKDAEQKARSAGIEPAMIIKDKGGNDAYSLTK